MPAPPLRWKEGKGFDLHLLRNGPSSKPLIDDLDIDPAQKSKVLFLPRLDAGSDLHGVGVISATGVVNAITPPDASFPKVRNFILTATYTHAPGENYEAEMRVHIHDAVEALWLTPPTLTIHKDFDECRFTVLARFTDKCVGDITDWDQLTYASGAPSVVSVSTNGVLKAEATSGSAPITVSHGPVNSPPAKALPRPSWVEVARDAKVDFVAGKRRPNPGNPFGAEVDSVKSVVENAKNILFIAEGFRQDQRFDFRNIVNLITTVLRGEEAATAKCFEPFGILKNAINYWVVFLPSENNGITILGRHITAVLDGKQIGALMLPNTRPSPTADQWPYLEFLYEIGLPIESDAPRSLTDLVSDWQKLFGSKVTVARTTEAFDVNWKYVPFHSVLNERDTVFGLTAGVRQRLDWAIPEIVEVQVSTRRTQVASIHKFLENLTFGGFPIGSRWIPGGEDFGLAGFLCLSDKVGGVEISRQGTFAVSTGRNKLQVDLKKAPDSGWELVTGPVISTYRHIMAGIVAHEVGHALGDLGDEYGDGAGGTLTNGSSTEPREPNLQAKSEVAAAPVGTAPSAYDPTKIRWAWPRITKAGVLTRSMLTTDVTATGVRVPLRKRHGRIFAVGEVVRFKEIPVSLDASFDLFDGKFFKVKTVEDDAVILIPVTTTTGTNDVTEVAMSTFSTDLFMIPFSGSPQPNFSLIKPLRRAGEEIKLVPELILKHIQDKDGPLNADPATPTGACLQASSKDSVMTPRNLPQLPRLPRTKADIIGIYEGGSYNDCGVFRPAGRCKMRASDSITIPFCFVCRYIFVDRVDPTRHAELDRLYPEVV